VEIVLRATALFFVVWLVTRVTGKRALSQMTAFEMVLLVTIGDLIQQGTTQEDMSVTGAAVVVSVIAFWTVVFAYVSWRWKGMRRLIDGLPVIILEDGEPIPEALRIERIPMEPTSPT
jgi:uncharacterized membrane protein YcaP (DUF421 family)